MQGAVYILCSLTALACAVLLLRGYRQNGARLLLWCGIFFAAMAIENAILFADSITGPAIDLSGYRRGTALAGMALLMYGLIWNSK